MASEYEKKTVAQLQEILKARGLTTTGKKADLIARLQGADKASTESKQGAATEDIIDWDDEAPATEAPLTQETAQASTEAGAATIAAGGQGQVPNPVAVPNQALGEDPAKTSDLHVESTGDVAGQAAVEAKPVVDYSIGLQPTEVEEELKKRKARAEKFGIVAQTGADTTEAEKVLERAKRFGTGASSNDSGVGVNRLDQALPNERERKRGHGNQQGGRGGRQRNFGGRGRFNNRKGNNPTGRSNDPKPVFSDKDKNAADARKKRFSAAA